MHTMPSTEFVRYDIPNCLLHMHENNLGIFKEHK